jgi:GTP cyclohydrolase II
MIQPATKGEVRVPTVHRFAESVVPTGRGEARMVVYREVGSTDREHVAYVIGNVAASQRVLVRVHSECLTSEVFGSLKCDCREQLDGALDAIHAAGAGALIYLRQEGRGIGLGNKIRAYAFQAEGADTIEANHRVGFVADLRSYDIAADMLHDLGVHSVTLMTNNPKKIEGLERCGIRVAQRKPIEIEPTATTSSYLRTKRDKMGHLLRAFDVPK